jgi:predicted aspartyl protease
MRAVRLLLACLLGVAGCTPPGGAAPQPAAAAAEGEGLSGFLAAQGYRTVPLRRLATGHFAIDGMAGATTLTLIVDTGASHTILDRQRAGRFGLVLRRERSRAAGLGVADQEVASGMLRDVEVGPLRFDSLAVSVLDLSHVNQALRGVQVAPVDGILGADLLLRKRAVIDYGAMRLHLWAE